MTDAITALFATLTEAFTPIVGQPTDDDIFRMREILMPALNDLQYDMMPAPHAITHNLVGLIQETSSYSHTWSAPFVRPTRVAAYDVSIPETASSVVRNREEAIHKAKLADFATYLSAERATALFIRSVVDEVWYKDLRHPVTFYNSVTAYDLLNHLVINSGGLHRNDLVNLPSEMLHFYEKAEGIPEFILMLEEAREKLARGKLPMSDEILLATASSQVFASLHYPKATREWEQLPTTSQTWPAWQVKYRLAHIERKRLLLANPNSFGGASTNSVIGTDTASIAGYLDNLALAATNDSNAMAQLTAQLDAITKRLNELSTAAPVRATTSHSAPTGVPYVEKVYTQAEALQIFDPTGYCHSHGYRVHASHTSATCKRRGPNHDATATRANIKRGSKKNKGWEKATAPM